MTNREVAAKISLLGKLLELKGESPFRTKAYKSAYIILRKWPDSLVEMSLDNLQLIRGLGKSISEKIFELGQSGKIKDLEDCLGEIPSGVVDLLGVKGLGSKKVLVLWKELGINSLGELLYACQENRLVSLKGFGEKSQNDIADKVSYAIMSQGRFLYADLESLAQEVIEKLEAEFPDEIHSLTGVIRRKCNTLTQVEILTSASLDTERYIDEIKEDARFPTDILPLSIMTTSKELFATELFRTTGLSSVVNQITLENKTYQDEEEIFDDIKKPYVVPEMREIESMEIEVREENLVTISSIKGLIHCHTTFSDGVNTIEEMAAACVDQGLSYMLITDHSRSAVYANGLSDERVIEQINAIREINEKRSDIEIFAGIESDIKSDGSLDYEEDILQLFDVVIASIHSGLNMDIKKATNRLIKAIENPHTRIIGHPSGRLLLSREGYPLDYERIIEACAINDVVIELNANPRRLDLDWRQIPGCTKNNVMISINPDAHSTAGIEDIKYGVYAARKGGLTKKSCLNTKSVDEFLHWMNSER